MPVITKGNWRQVRRYGGPGAHDVIIRSAGVCEAKVCNGYALVVPHAEVHVVTRLNNSYTGNPRWSLLVKHGGQWEPFITSSDYGINYDINNLKLPGQRVNLYLTRAGRVVGIETLGGFPR